MDQNRFFRLIWRFNALLLALGGILIVGAVAWNLTSWNRWESTPKGHFAPVPKDAEKNSTYRLQSTAVSVPGEAILALHEWNGPPRTYGLADAVYMRGSFSYVNPLDGVNLLAVDSASSSGHWLFHGYRRAVLSEVGIPRENTLAVPGFVQDAVAIVIQTTDSDTNKDGELTDKDVQSLYFYRPGMQLAQKFLDADYIITREQTGADSFLVVYERGKSAIAATFSVPDFKLKSEKPLPSVPN